MVYSLENCTAPNVVLIYRIMRADGLNRIEAIKDAVFLAAQDVSVNDDLSTLNFPDSAHLPMDRLD